MGCAECYDAPYTIEAGANFVKIYGPFLWCSSSGRGAQCVAILLAASRLLLCCLGLDYLFHSTSLLLGQHLLVNWLCHLASIDEYLNIVKRLWVNFHVKDLKISSLRSNLHLWDFWSQPVSFWYRLSIIPCLFQSTCSTFSSLDRCKYIASKHSTPGSLTYFHSILLIFFKTRYLFQAFSNSLFCIFYCQRSKICGNHRLHIDQRILTQ